MSYATVEEQRAYQAPSAPHSRDGMYPYLNTAPVVQDTVVNGLVGTFERSVQDHQTRLGDLRERYVQPFIQEVENVRDHERRLDDAVTKMEKQVDKLKEERRNLEKEVADQVVTLKKEGLPGEGFVKQHWKAALLVAGVVGGIAIFVRGLPVNVTIESWPTDAYGRIVVHRW